jgi:serine/threonine protein phosphatase PrpC
MRADELWRLIEGTERGASHARQGTSNQDAVLSGKGDDPAPWAVVAVSDGHGSSRCFRSADGARIAVETAIEVGREFLTSQPAAPNLAHLKCSAQERLPRAILDRWRDKVLEHCGAEPFSPEELSRLVDGEPHVGRSAIDDRAESAYGATLITCLVTTQFVICLQIGDGDILSVSSTAEVSRPLPVDPRLFANETTSLISEDACCDFRCDFQTLAGRPPALMLLSTDGYSNSFVNEHAFTQVGADLLEILRTEGADHIKECLPDWLKQASEAGSGDDITIAVVIWNEVAADRAVPRLEEDKAEAKR